MPKPSRAAQAHVRAQDQRPVPPLFEPQIFLLTGWEEAVMLRDGQVPESIAAQARAAVEWEFEMRAKTPLPAGVVTPDAPKRKSRQ